MFSKEYLNELHILHSMTDRYPKAFGGKVKNLGEFYSFIEKWKPASLLDYGCGKGTILNHLIKKYPSISIQGYDPAVDEYKSITGIFDCVFSNDVLEHIEPEYIDDVLNHIRDLSNKFVWLRIDTSPARKTLSDGRNAHLIQASEDWWINKIKEQIDSNIVYSELNRKGKLDIAIEKSDPR